MFLNKMFLDNINSQGRRELSVHRYIKNCAYGYIKLFSIFASRYNNFNFNNNNKGKNIDFKFKFNEFMNSKYPENEFIPNIC